jgi:uncharacterized protein YkwD
MKKIIQQLMLCFLLLCVCIPSTGKQVEAAPLQEVSASDLISLINGMRVANGLPALNINSILMSTAQQTSDTMAINDIHSHIGNVSGRVMAAGYGGGATAWATENFAIGPMTISDIQAVWADADHMIPVVNANYTDIGAGVTSYNGRTWYIVHAAYSSGGSAVRSTAVPGAAATPEAVVPDVSQIIIPVETIMPNADGSVIHKVQSGQALWSIAIAYNTKVEELIRLNNLSTKDPIIYIGQNLVVFSAKITQTSTLPAQATGDGPTTTQTATFTPTRTATRTPSATRPPATATIAPTATQVNVLQAQGMKMLGDNHIGTIILGVLAAGILLMAAGSFSRLKK